MVLHSLFDPYQERFKDIEKSFQKDADLVGKHAESQHFLKTEQRHEEEATRRLLKEQEQRKLKRGAVLKDLNAQDYEDAHAKHNKKRHGNSGQWLLDSEEFDQWLSRQSGGLLWCYGNPGFGKTVLASIVIEDLRRRLPVSEEAGIVFAYASYKDIESSRSPLRFLATFILQLSRQRTELSPELEAYYELRNSDARPHTFSGLQEVFAKMIRSLRSLYLVVDALDEIETGPRREFLKFLAELVPLNDEKLARDGCVVKIFVTSRKERDIEQRFACSSLFDSNADLCRFSDRSCLQIQATKVASDIDAFVRDEIEKRIKTGDLHLGGDNELKEQIFTTLSTKASGMFLWARYQLDHVTPPIKSHRQI